MQSNTVVRMLMGILLLVTLSVGGGYLLFDHLHTPQSAVSTEENKNILIASSSTFLHADNVGPSTAQINNNNSLSTSTPCNNMESDWPSKGDRYHIFSPTRDAGVCGMVDDGTIGSGIYAGYHRVFAYREIGDGLDAQYYFFLLATKDYHAFIWDKNRFPVDVDPGFAPGVATEAGSIPFDFPTSIEDGNFVLSSTLTDPSIHWKGLVPLSETTENTPEGKIPEGYIGDLSFFPNQNSSVVMVQDPGGLIIQYTFELKIKNPELQDSMNNNAFLTRSQLNVSTSTYERYGSLVPFHCGVIGYDTKVLSDIAESSLERVGTTNTGIDLFVIKARGADIYKEHYDTKIIPKPSFEAYVNKHPILVFKDNWKRWIGVGEMDYNERGECGKPVIYLYPPTPTDVSIAFLAPMKLNIDIPRYHDGWKVHAMPDGTLTDLQPQYTNCSSIDFTKRGSEYAATLCPKGDYSYLYWAGQSSNIYPEAPGGWVIKRNELRPFIETKLSEIGLSEKERADMLEYWVPELRKTAAPYYRLSFFQTNEMNAFVPMSVTPKPDTVIRVFLDWEPLGQIPARLPSAQKLTHIVRKGFIFVEWGGLKR